MSNLIERLRNDSVSLVRDWDVTRDTLREAADEIERLQKRNALLEDVAVAAKSVNRWHETVGSPLTDLENALDKLREVGDE